MFSGRAVAHSASSRLPAYADPGRLLQGTEKDNFTAVLAAAQQVASKNYHKAKSTQACHVGVGSKTGKIKTAKPLAGFYYDLWTDIRFMTLRKVFFPKNP
ncbi:hypothetical protein NDU88_007894 [Pleurodeles waltl]|uniref:Uncharacterized protein n=1 Tax=Pleurodeles waltl TaxID=8319 RepID=A0AAV7VUS8_PLEWA|nr:hypothetical protein NDU88_007894 [Pleurodeles waltl]